MKRKKHGLNEPFEFEGRKVYREDKLFEPETISSWKEKGQVVAGTNLERMVSGRAFIGIDCRPIMLYPMTQEKNGSIVEILYSLYQEKNSVPYIQPNRNFIRKAFCWISQKFFLKSKKRKSDNANIESMASEKKLLLELMVRPVILYHMQQVRSL